jgi:hypothetical protein
MKVQVIIPRGSKVFLLEDSEERIHWFRDRLPEIVVANNVTDAIVILAGQVFDYVFLDHDLGLLDYAGDPGTSGTGAEVARYLSGRGFVGKNVFIHSWNTTGAARMKDILKGAFAVPWGQFDIMGS